MAKKSTRRVRPNASSASAQSTSAPAVHLHFDETSLTCDAVKELIGWTSEPDGVDWGANFALKDRFGKKIQLAKNPTNRPLKKQIAERYALEFLRGKWHFNGEPLIIGQSGEVRDGQHRAVAFILAEQSRAIDQKQWGETPLRYPVVVVTGISDESEVADSIDLGQQRSLNDVMFRHENASNRPATTKSARALSEAIRMVWLRAGGKTISSAPHFPHSEALEFYAAHPGLLESVEEILHLNEGLDGNESLLKPFLPLGVSAALHYLMSQIDADKAAEFWTAVAQGAGLSTGDPMLTLRNLLPKMEGSSGKSRDLKVGAVIKAWLAFMEGDTVTPKALQVKCKKETDANGVSRTVPAEYPRIGGIDAEVTVVADLNERQKRVLSALANAEEEIDYKTLSKLTGLTLSGAKRVCEGEAGLLAAELVAVNTYEAPEGRQPVVMVSATAEGVSRVR